jgi:PiT family inorganic phosphate transporter
VFGNDSLGVIVVLLLVVGLIAAAFGSRLRRGPALTAAEA